MFAALPGQAGPRRARARHPRALGARAAPSSSCGPRTPTGHGSASSTGRSRPTRPWRCTRRGAAPSRTSSSGTRRCAGHHQRYQNGFDCQGLWIEVGVERELGLNSKREIEEYGLAEFARRCRAVVERSSADLTKGSIRLGQWMDWGRDYFTFSDTNIEYIWRFLAIIHERGWLFRGHRATEWCPRCGTSISAHELAGSYVDREDPSLTVRFPLLDRPGPGHRHLDHHAVDAARQRGRRRVAHRGVRPPGQRRLGGRRARRREPPSRRSCRGRDLVGLRYEGPFDALGPGAGVEHRVIGWDEVSLEEGTGVVHIAPGCRHGGLRAEQGRGPAGAHPRRRVRPASTPSTAGWPGARPTTPPTTSSPTSASAASSSTPARSPTGTPSAGAATRRSSSASPTTGSSRVDEIREPMREANRTVEWTPEYMGKRMDDWLVNMSDWNISRRRYYGLPLPFYPCSCGHLTVVGLPRPAGRARHRSARRARGAAPALDRRRGHPLPASAARTSAASPRWATCGSTPASCRSPRSGGRTPSWIDEGYATGAAKGLTTADLPDHAYWEEWFPADWVSEMREQIRLWFYSQLFMSVALTGRAPYRKVLGYEKMLDETGREMHGSWGNMIEAEDAFARMGADVMRWQYCAQPPSQNLLFGFGPGPGDPAQAAHALEQHRLLRPVRQHRRLHPRARRPRRRPQRRPDAARPVARRPHPPDGARGHRRLRAVPDGERARGRSRRSSTTSPTGTSAAHAGASGTATRRRCARCGPRWSTALRVVSPIMPFLTEHLWQVLVAGVVPERADVGLPRRLAVDERRPTTTCSTTSRPCGGSSTSAGRPGPRPS